MAGRLGPGSPVRKPGVRSLLRLATIDVGPLRRHRDVRLLFVGRGTTFLGAMATYVAIPFQHYHVTARRARSA